ncbi:hypothetical protein DPX16_13748 [Anabarilius grahami]|uniref:Uncharacterized protein n=1 Tax=Anabarilius grahami TaxID=495550 RepID=A0A3N0XRW7_ANAGA|nr:hypothetical protein DPX16_13748 [Anabarilius grahami]
MRGNCVGSAQLNLQVLFSGVDVPEGTSAKDAPVGASQYPSSSPRSSVLHPMTRKPIELSHLEGHINSLIAPRGGEDRGVRKLPEES